LCAWRLRSISEKKKKRGGRYNKGKEKEKNKPQQMGKETKKRPKNPARGAQNTGKPNQFETEEEGRTLKSKTTKKSCQMKRYI